ncbi:hypothetical protein SPBR_06286 [Sporothrix brasiliensis 5110]|uniref:Uncharacterized protein n=1 Tax=Sporothrix brasiliensis 5110 TaxID=1398154 RepID=A0A0C2J625_9PEZI|nr:uncharacterized protein SPBR_06286 [Sporothrix brasiliensis 5110]KIH94435.1 hypothetical protein SPBR_06286 [Sporothrix brasiliensis 5110]
MPSIGRRETRLHHESRPLRNIGNRCMRAASAASTKRSLRTERQPGSRPGNCRSVVAREQSDKEERPSKGEKKNVDLKSRRGKRCVKLEV